MVRIISEPSAHTAIIAVARASIFYAKGAVPDKIEHLVRADRIMSGEVRMVAKKDLILMVGGLWSDPCTGANNIFFMRADRTGEGAGALWPSKPHCNPKLSKALDDAADVPQVMAIGGFDRVLVYSDEIAVPELQYGFGLYGWIIKRDDVEKYLKSVSLENDPGKLDWFTIWHETHIDHNGDKYPVVRIEGWSVPPIKEDATLCSTAEYSILFNTESRIVQGISLTNSFVEGVPCKRSPIRSVAVGRKLPGNLGIKR